MGEVFLLVLVAQWIHFTLFGIITHSKTKSVNFLGLMNSATKWLGVIVVGLVERFRMVVCVCVCFVRR